jgi:lipopolysaccharide heptosyltransferase II
VIRLDLLGDVLFSMQGVEALRRRYPNAHITVLVLPYTAPLARLFPSASEVLTVDTNRIRAVRGLLDPRTWVAYWRVVRALRSRRFDVAVSLSGQMGSLWAHLSGAPRTIGYAGEAYPHLLTDPVPGGRFLWRIPDISYVSRLVETIGAAPIDWAPVLPVPSRILDAGRHALQRAGIDPALPLVLVHVGSINGSAKRWPVGHWAGFVDGLHARTGAQTVLIGSSSDRPLADEVLRACTSSPVSLAGETDIEGLIGVLAHASLVASGDSGPLHLAAALTRPVLAVYGPTDPRIHGPFLPVAPLRLHRADIVCSPCYSMAATAECPLGDPICMRLVSVERMLESAEDLLQAAANTSF